MGRLFSVALAVTFFFVSSVSASDITEGMIQDTTVDCMNAAASSGFPGGSLFETPFRPILGPPTISTPLVSPLLPSTEVDSGMVSGAAGEDDIMSTLLKFAEETGASIYVHSVFASSELFSPLSFEDYSAIRVGVEFPLLSTPLNDSLNAELSYAPLSATLLEESDGSFGFGGMELNRCNVGLKGQLYDNVGWSAGMSVEVDEVDIGDIGETPVDFYGGITVAF